MAWRSVSCSNDNTCQNTVLFLGQVYIQNVSMGEAILNMKKKKQKAPIQNFWGFIADSVILSRNGCLISFRYECLIIKI